MVHPNRRPVAAQRLVIAAAMLALLFAGMLGIAQLATATTTIITQWTFNSPTPDNNTNTGTTDPAIGSGNRFPRRRHNCDIRQRRCERRQHRPRHRR